MLNFPLSDGEEFMNFFKICILILVVITSIFLRKSKGLVLMIMGITITLFSLTLRLEKSVCCSHFVGVKLGSAIDVWRNNMMDYDCVCGPVSIPPGMMISLPELAPNYYYIPIEYIILGLIIFFIGLKIYKKKNN